MPETAVTLILASGYVEVDETFVKLLDRDRSGRAHTAYLWTYRAPCKGTVFQRVRIPPGKSRSSR